MYWFRLVQNLALTVDQVLQLIALYDKHFHPYLPLVPRKYFDPRELDRLAATEKHLLTAVLTVASKTLADMPHIHHACAVCGWAG